MKHSEGYGGKNAPMGSKKKLTQKDMGALIKHSKMHDGGMKSKHMTTMISEMKKGKTFGEAHNIAKGNGKKSTITLGGKKIEMKYGALRKQLGVPDDEKITMNLLRRIMDADVGDMIDNPFKKTKLKVTTLLKRRASLGRTLKKMKK